MAILEQQKKDHHSEPADLANASAASPELTRERVLHTVHELLGAEASQRDLHGRWSLSIHFTAERRAILVAFPTHHAALGAGEALTGSGDVRCVLNPPPGFP